MVDSWGVYRDTYAPSGDYFSEISKEQQTDNRLAAELLTEFAERRREIIHTDTIEAAKQVEDGSLDFVFVDADHSYEGCAGDIAAWFPKLKAGGLLCGHDYENDRFPKWGVKQAVHEFANKHGLEVDLGADTTWFIRLPGPLPKKSEWYDEAIIACVKWGTKYSSGYVNVLADMVDRNLTIPVRFVCLTDDPTGLDDGIETVPIPRDEFKGWWNKCRLFAPGIFPPRSRILYIDLDSVIVGNLDDMVRTRGITADWIQGGYASCAMTWDEGEHRAIWEKLTQSPIDRLWGDQDWMMEVSRWPYYPPEWSVSYRLHATEWPPEGAKIVNFHGLPKPDEVTEGWVPELWQMGGLAQPRCVSALNNDVAEMRANVGINLARANVPSIELGAAQTSRALVVVGGGPSLAEGLLDLQIAKARGDEIWALNGACDWLVARGIIPDAMVMLDSRPENVAFVQEPLVGVKYYIATQCAPAVFEALDGYDVRKWTAWLYGGVTDRIIIGGGATVGLKSLCLGHVLGFRRFKLFGFDSSYRDGEDHAYTQPLNAGIRTVEVILRGKRYLSAAWMVKQVREFQDLSRTLAGGGCEIEVYGEGLLQEACKMAFEQAAE